jgi:hypothetical protein
MLRSAGDGPLAVNAAFAGKPSGDDAVADDSGPKNQKGTYQKPRVGSDVVKRSASSADGAGGNPVRALLEEPPGWLAKQLARCKADPERWLKPTAAALVHEAHGPGAAAGDASESELRRWLEGGNP